MAEINHEAVLDATEKSLDVLEDRLDEIEGAVDVVRNNPIVLVTVGVLGLAAGAAGGYFVAKKKLKSFYEDVASQEIAEARQFFAQVNKVDEDGVVLTPQDVMAQRHGEAAVEAVRTYQGRHDAIDEVQNSEHVWINQGEPHDEVVDEAQIQKIEAALAGTVTIDPNGEKNAVQQTVEKVETTNVFVDPTFDLDEEKKYRTEDKPYIITHDEYFAAEKEYDTISLTYFEVDDTLVDEKDQPVENTDDTIGDDHLVRFGHGSKDRNIVYVRNDNLQVDFEIVKSAGSYLEEVLGMTDEEPNSLKHSDQRDRRRAFRHGDE